VAVRTIDTLRCHVIFPCRLHVARRLKNWHCVIHPYPELSLQCMFLAQTEAEARGQQVIGNLSRVGGIRSSEVESCGSFVTSALRLPLSENLCSGAQSTSPSGPVPRQHPLSVVGPLCIHVCTIPLYSLSAHLLRRLVSLASPCLGEQPLLATRCDGNR